MVSSDQGILKDAGRESQMAVTGKYDNAIHEYPHERSLVDQIDYARTVAVIAAMLYKVTPKAEAIGNRHLAELCPRIDHTQHIKATQGNIIHSLRSRTHADAIMANSLT